GVAAGAQPTKEKSGRFVVRVPKTIHQKLDIEAKREGVSLNQLAVTKLSLPLPKSTGIAESVVIQAFNKTHEGYSPDWVIIEPHQLKRVDLRSDVYDLVSAGPVKRVSLSDIASLPGTYVFYDYNRPLFAGESDNLNRRLSMHLQGGLPRWLSPHDEEGIILKYT